MDQGCRELIEKVVGIMFGVAFLLLILSYVFLAVKYLLLTVGGTLMVVAILIALFVLNKIGEDK